jgi:hypothetical protein
MTYLRISRRRFGGRSLTKPIQGLLESSVARRWNLIQTKFAHSLRSASRSFRGMRFTNWGERFSYYAQRNTWL